MPARREAGDLSRERIGRGRRDFSVPAAVGPHGDGGRAFCIRMHVIPGEAGSVPVPLPSPRLAPPAMTPGAVRKGRVDASATSGGGPEERARGQRSLAPTSLPARGPDPRFLGGEDLRVGRGTLPWHIPPDRDREKAARDRGAVPCGGAVMPGEVRPRGQEPAHESRSWRGCRSGCGRSPWCRHEILASIVLRTCIRPTDAGDRSGADKATRRVESPCAVRMQNA
jgi:hypothetical protein